MYTSESINLKSQVINNIMIWWRNKMKKVVIQKCEPIKHLFKTDHGFMVENLRFNIRIAWQNPKKMRLHIQIWIPLIHIIRDNSKWELGNKYRAFIYH